MEHYCEIHKTKFFKTPNMKGFAHPILDADSNSTGKWCNEPKSEAQASQPQKQWTPSGYKGKSPEELDLSRRSYALSYAKDLAVAGIIAVKDIPRQATEFSNWLKEAKVE